MKNRRAICEEIAEEIKDFVQNETKKDIKLKLIDENEDKDDYYLFYEMTWNTVTAKGRRSGLAKLFVGETEWTLVEGGKKFADNYKGETDLVNAEYELREFCKDVVLNVEQEEYSRLIDILERDLNMTSVGDTDEFYLEDGAFTCLGIYPKDSEDEEPYFTVVGKIDDNGCLVYEAIYDEEGKYTESKFQSDIYRFIQKYL
jgi:hypothetical protein